MILINNIIVIAIIASKSYALFAKV